MNILILDPEKKVSHRISKDTSGGYGTGNDFGDTPVPVFLKKTLKKVHDWPPMFALYSMAVLKKNNHNVKYKKDLPENYDEFDQYHLVYKHDLFSKKNIRYYLSKAYSSYYLRINWLFKYFRSFITS